MIYSIYRWSIFFIGREFSHDEWYVCGSAGSAVCHIHAPGHTGGVFVPGAGWPVCQGRGGSWPDHQGTGEALGCESKGLKTHPTRGAAYCAAPLLFVLFQALFLIRKLG